MEPTRTGFACIKRFISAQREAIDARRSLSSAECEERNAQDELAKWLMPKDMKPGEKIAIWAGDSLFQVELVAKESYPVGEGNPAITYEPKVTVRTRGPKYDELAL